MNLANTVALITGGKRIGLVVAEALAARGADVALTYARSRSEAEQAADLVRAAGRRALVLQADLSVPDSAAAAVEQVAASLGRLDILIHMASVYVQRPFETLQPADW